MESYFNFSVLEWLMHCKEFPLPHVIPSSDSLPTCHTILLLWGQPFIAMCSWQNILDRWEHCNTFIKSWGWRQGAENTRKLWHSGFKRKVHDLSIKTFTVTGHCMTCSCLPNLFLAYLGGREDDSECYKGVNSEAIRMKTVSLWQYVLHVYSVHPRGVALPSATCIGHMEVMLQTRSLL